MPLALLTERFRRRAAAPRILPPPKPLARNYDVVIIGGGGHGLATAYYLAQHHGIRDVAVLEKGYLAGSTTAIVRSLEPCRLPFSLRARAPNIYGIAWSTRWRSFPALYAGSGPSAPPGRVD